MRIVNSNLATLPPQPAKVQKPTPKKTQGVSSSAPSSFEPAKPRSAARPALYTVGPAGGGSVSANPEPPPDSNSANAVQHLHDLQGQLDSDRATAASLDKKLQDELSQFGTGLTDAQVQAYEDAFHQKYKDSYDAVIQDEEKLAAELKSDVPMLEQRAGVYPSFWNGSAVPAIWSAYKDLANGSQAEATCNFIALLGDTANHAALAAAFSNEPDLSTTCQTAVVNAAPQILREQPNQDPASALDVIQGLYAKYNDIEQLRNDFFGGSLGNVGFAWNQVKNAVVRGQYNNLNALAQNFNDNSRAVKALTVIGVLYSGYNAVTAAQQGDLTETLRQIAGTAAGAGTLFATAAKAGLFGTRALSADLRFGKIALSAGESFANRLIPGASLVYNGISLLDDAHSGNYFSAFGDFVGVVGSVAEFFPLTAPFGFGLNIASSVIASVGDLFFPTPAQQDAQDLLPKVIGNDPGLVDTLENADGHFLWRLYHDRGMSPEQIQTVARETPGLLESPSSFRADWLMRIAASGGLSGQGFLHLLESIEGSGDPQSRETELHHFASGLAEYYYVDPQTIDDWKALISRPANDSRIQDRGPFQRALGYLDSAGGLDVTGGGGGGGSRPLAQ